MLLVVWASGSSLKFILHSNRWRPSQSVNHNVRTPSTDAMQPNTTVPISLGLHPGCPRVSLVVLVGGEAVAPMTEAVERTAEVVVNEA